MQSGYSSLRLSTRAEAESQGDAMAAALGCDDPTQVLACLRSRSLAQVLQALRIGTFEFVERPTHWAPSVDGVEIPDQPRRLYENGPFTRVPVIIGATRDEGWVWVDRSFRDGLTADQYETAVETEFGADAPSVLAEYPLAQFASPKNALAALTGDAEYLCEARRVARLVARTGTRVYLYSFQYEVDATSRTVSFTVSTRISCSETTSVPADFGLCPQRHGPGARARHGRLLDSLCGHRKSQRAPSL